VFFNRYIIEMLAGGNTALLLGLSLLFALSSTPSLSEIPMTYRHTSFLAFFALGLPLQATPQVDLGFESPAAITNWVNGAPPANYNGSDTLYHRMVEDGSNFDMPCCGVNVGTLLPWISSSTKYAGSRCLGMKIEPSTGEKDRMELRAIHGTDTNAVQFNQTRYFGYAIYIHSTSQYPTDWLHFTQVWQKHYESTAPGDQAPVPGVTVNKVPFTMSFLENKNQWKWRAVARTEAESVNVGEGVIGTGWNRFIYAFKPNHLGSASNGSIKIWVNSVTEASPTINWAGRWGVSPTAKGDGFSGSATGMDLRVGMYRAAQNTTQVFFLDQIKVGTTFADAKP
jgi:hypothetical protein